MHTAARPTHIRKIRRAIPSYSVEERAPALINLPISLPDIPIVSPIVTLLIAGINQQEGASTVTITTTVSTALTASPTESSVLTDSSSGNSNSSGGTDSSSGSSNTSDSSSGSVILDSTGSGSSDGSGGGSEVNLGSSGGSFVRTGSAIAGSGSESGTNLGATVSGSLTSTTSIVSFTNNDSPVNTFILSSSAIRSSGTGSIEDTDLPSSTRSSGTVTPTETTASTRSNSNSGPSVTDTATNIQELSASSVESQPTPNLNILSSNPTAGSVASGVSTDAVNGGDGTEGSGGGSSGGGGTGGGGGLPTGATVAISLIVPAIFAASLLLFIRQRFRAKRNKRNKWWFSNMKFREDDTKVSGSGTENTAGARSIRSSFGTSYEYNARSTPSFDVPVPALPPMAEVRRTHSPKLPMHNVPAGHQSPPLLVNVDNLPQPDTRGVSLYSTRSTSSEFYRQYLILGTNDREPATPMSAHPSVFVFPSPPRDTSSETTPKRDSGVLGSSSEANPFIGPSASFDHPPTPVPFPDVEIIRRPFDPTLHDEISVSVGDRVHVVKVFDDGWALVQKIPADPPSSKGKQVLPQAGLVPVDCLREPWQPLPSFLADKGVGGYSETGVAL